MRILLVNTRHYYGGGDSTYTFNLAELLKLHGHEISFFGMRHENNLADPNADLFVSTIDYRTLNKRKNPVTALKVLTRSIYSMEARHKFSQILERVNPDIIHLQSIHAHITPSVIFEAKQRCIPVVWTLHDYKLICPNSACLIDKTGKICEACHGGRFWQTLFTRCKKDSFLASSMAGLEAYVHRMLNIQAAVDVFLAPSRFLQERLLSNGFPEDKVYHLPLFLPTNSFQLEPHDQGYFLFLGRLVKLKGIYILAEAARMVPDAQIIVVGMAEESILNQLPDLFPPNMHYFGFKTGADLINLIRNARAVLVPSQWYENQPFSILEAFAIGKPVIATDIGGMRELVGETRGLLVPLGSPSVLAAAIRKLFSDPTEARKLGLNAFEYAKNHHSPDAHYLKLNDLYGKLLIREG